jgi:hypothetical protein
VRRIGVIGFLAIVLSASPAAVDANDGCDAPFEFDAEPNAEPSPQPLLTRNQCDAIEARELRAPLLEIPQEDEDPMRLSLGIKNGGLALRLKIPFSF